MPTTVSCSCRSFCCFRSWKKRWRDRKSDGTALLSSSSRSELGLMLGENVHSTSASAASAH